MNRSERWARPFWAGAWVALAATLVACGGGSGAPVSNSAPEPPTGAASVPSVPGAALRVLMLGNSHTVFGGLPSHLEAMLRATWPGRDIEVEVAPGYLFLDERLSDRETLALLQNHRWQAVVLQAQKYSTSGLFSYSTAEAEQLVKMVRSAGATPVMFPEWPRSGIPETARIWALYGGIATRAVACLAGVPQAWDLAQARDPALALHSRDGNHANENGAFLAALMLFSSLTDLSPLRLPDLPGGVPPAVQRQLREAAADTARAQSARATCPDDPVLGS